MKLTPEEALAILEQENSYVKGFPEAVEMGKEALRKSIEYGWHCRHADPHLDVYPPDNENILLTIITYNPKGCEVVKGVYWSDEGWSIDYQDDYGEFDVIAWAKLPEPYGKDEK